MKRWLVGHKLVVQGLSAALSEINFRSKQTSACLRVTSKNMCAVVYRWRPRGSAGEVPGDVAVLMYMSMPTYPQQI